MPPVVVQKPSYPAKLIGAVADRGVLPKRFVNALLYYGLNVVIGSWICAGAADRTLLRNAAKKENAYARGFTKAAWMRLPMAEKFAILRGNTPVEK